MTVIIRLLVASTAFLLFSCAIVANVTDTPMSQMRGLWVTQAMRGMVH